MSKLIKLKPIIKDLHDSVEKLNNLYPHRKFTLDGRLVGDIGEVIAEQIYKIKLFEKNEPYYDALTIGTNRKVQIKATFKKSLTFNHMPDYYIGIKLYDDGKFEEVYNGPGKYIYDEFKHRKGIGEVLLSFPLKRLGEISERIPEIEKISKWGDEK